MYKEIAWSGNNQSKENKLDDPSGRWLAGIAGSNPFGGYYYLFILSDIFCRVQISATG
jgi:hypothetical protein